VFGETLYTRRLLLRRVQADDLPRLVSWSRSPEACGDFLSLENYNEEQMRQQLAAGVYWSERERLYLIALRDTTPIGVIHYWRSPGQEGEVVMALKIAVTGQRNKGYGTEAQKYLIMYLFERHGVNSVAMYTDVNNQAEQRCLQKLGFELVESLTYEDQHVRRTGHLYRLGKDTFARQPIYQYHFE